MLKDRISALIKPTDFRYLKKRDIELYNDILNETSFLSEESTLSERVYCIKNDIKEISKCECGNILKYEQKKVPAQYQMFCSRKCLARSKYRKKKTKETSLQKYGTEHPLQNNDILQKQKNTNIKKYGVENISQHQESRKKYNETIKTRTREENEIINDKRRDTCENRYGTDSITRVPEVRQKVEDTLIERYGVKNSYLLDHVRNKLKINYNEKFGDIISLLKDKDWLVEQHHDLKKSMKQIASDLGVSNGMVKNYIENAGVDIRLYGYSSGEKEILDFIKSNYTGTILENDRTIIKPKELDIVLPDLKIAIEYCGVYWHSSKFVDKNYHIDKLTYCNENGYRLITIFEDEWEYNKDIYKRKILNIIGIDKNQRIYARTTNIMPYVSMSDRKQFLNQYHIQGDGPGSISYGLEYNGEIVSVMTFKKRTPGVYELNRFASSCNVVGGFSKLLSYFKKNNEWNEIISFADRRWSEGNVYFKAGFELKSVNSPDYKYIVNGVREHKFGFRNKNLSKILESYSGGSEKEETEKNDLLRIYDCGLLKFVIKK